MRLLTLLACTLLCACISTPGYRPDTAIDKADYPEKSASAEEVFAFFQRATAADDPEAAYFCMGRNIKATASLVQFYEGWTLVGRYLRLFRDAKVGGARDVRQGRLLTVELCGLKEPFLFEREVEGYRLVLPNPHNDKTLEDLFAALKQHCAGKLDPHVRPERRGG